MTSKQKLIKICQIKAKLIKKHIDIDNYFTPEDQKEIENWSAIECLRIVETMKKALDVTDFSDCSDAKICPWCIFYGLFCNICSYGAKHGKCDDIDSLYNKIAQQSNHFGSAIIQISTLMTKIKKILG